MSTARLRQELTRLRERTRPAQGRTRFASESFEDFQAREIPRRNREIPSTVKVCRSRLGWLALVGKLGEFVSAEDLIDDVMEGPDGSGCLQPPEERSRVLVSREVYVSIWRADEGLEHLEVPPAWAEVFAAADEWRERMLAVPIEVLAHWVRANRALIEQGAEGGQIEALAAKYLGPYGITEALAERVAGPDRDVLSSEEAGWLIHAPLSDDFCSRWAFEVGEEIRKLDEREGGN